MVMRPNNTELTTIIALLIHNLLEYEEPGYAEYFLNKLRDRLRRSD